MKKILIVDDEKTIVETVRAYLEKENFEVFEAYDGQEALKIFNLNKPDLIILDLMLPKISGEEVCKNIREASSIPIIMLSAKINVDSKLTGFDLGADDYLTKPFSPKELVARVHSLFRRVDINDFNMLIYNNGDLCIHLDSFMVEKKRAILNLTPNEYKILVVLAQNENKTFTRDDLITAINADDEIYERTIDSHIKNLRNKIDDSNNKYIVTVRGFGYKFNYTSKENI